MAHPLGLILAISLLVVAGAAHAGDRTKWVAAWGASPLEKINIMVDDPKPAPKVAGSFRYYISLGLGGDQLRVRISNEISPESLTIAGASVALANPDGSLRADTLRSLGFSGEPGARIPARAPMLSDAVSLQVRRGDLLAVTLYIPAATRPDLGGQSPRLVHFFKDRDATRDLKAKGTPQAFSSLVTEIDVSDSHARGVIVTLGDSITQGKADRPLDEKGVASWPEQLLLRLAERGQILGVVNAGIGGNRVLAAGMGDAALARFDRDVTAIAGATHLIVAEGINDIGFTGVDFFDFFEKPTINDPRMLIAAYRQLIARAHARGLKAIGTTITPFEGAFYYSPEKDAVRQAVNAWVRESGAFDGVIDFDAAVRDPKHPTRLAAAYDSGDHLHPSAAGLDRMAQAIDLDLFR